MGKLTYQQAYDKIIDAYFKNKIKPMDAKFCFCGTLSPNQYWLFRRYQNGINRVGVSVTYPYSVIEYMKMENALFSGIRKTTGIDSVTSSMYHINYEEALFNGMYDALEVLKKNTHFKRGNY